jgi:hypothetical protein
MGLAQSNIIPLRPPGFLFEEAWRGTVGLEASADFA